MPIYAFQCSDCGLEYEELVPRMGDVAPCPKCQDASNVNKQMSATADYRASSSGGSMPTPADCQACGMPPCAGGMCAMQ